MCLGFSDEKDTWPGVVADLGTDLVRSSWVLVGMTSWWSVYALAARPGPAFQYEWNEDFIKGTGVREWGTGRTERR